MFVLYIIKLEPRWLTIQYKCCCYYRVCFMSIIGFVLRIIFMFFVCLHLLIVAVFLFGLVKVGNLTTRYMR